MTSSIADTRPLVVVTGAAGGVARLLLPALSAHYRLRLTDVRSLGPVVGYGDTVHGDIADGGFVRDVFAGAAAVVHLAGNPMPHASLDDLVEPNIRAVDTVLAGALAAGVDRVVLASSVHASGGYERANRYPVRPELPPRPCCRYGASKAFDEALAAWYAQQHDLAVICLRLGWVIATPPDESALGCWLGPDDLGQLVRCSLVTKVRFGCYFGVSANSIRQWDTDNARDELGYRPVLDSEQFRGRVPGSDGLGTCRMP